MSAGWRQRAAPIGTGLVVPLCALAAYLVVSWAQLPHAVASHWDQHGRADAFVIKTTRLWVTPLVLIGGSWALIAIATATVPRGATGGRWLRALPAGVAWFATVLTCAMIGSQRGIVDSQLSRFSAWWIVVSVIGGLVGYGLTRLVIPEGASDSADAESGTGPDVAQWRGVARADPALYLGLVAIGVGGVWALIGMRLVIGTALLTVTLLIAATTTYRVSVDDQAVRIRGLLLGYPLVIVPLAGLTAAQVAVVRLREWHGVGVRQRPSGTGILTRGGDALRLVDGQGHETVVSVEHPNAAAAAVNARLAKR